MAEDRYRVFLDVEAGRGAGDAAARGERPFRILVLGDFAGGAERGRDLRPVRVDRDNLDRVLAALRPLVRFPLGGSGPEVSTTFECLDDFHPDRLLRRVPLLDSLCVLREQARTAGFTAPAAPPPAAAAPAPRPAGGLLDQIVAESAGATPATPASAAAPPSDLHAFIRSAVAPLRVHEPDSRQAALAAQVDDTLHSVLRALLHHPQFQALESAWRGLDLLVRRLETDAELQLFLLDIPRAQLERELAHDEGALAHVLVRAREHGEPWAVLAGLFSFTGSPEDAAALARLAALARRAGAPFLAGAAPALAGVASFESEPDATELSFDASAGWQALRRSADARWLGLAAPRLLLRVPYDPREEPCEDVALVEMTSPPAHEDYLWGSGALMPALLLGQAFEANGWRMQPGDALVLDGLPLHVYRDGTESVAKPCAEALITDRVAVRLLDAGLMPLLSRKHGDSVRLAEFQSVAEPPAELAGAWVSSA